MRKSGESYSTTRRIDYISPTLNLYSTQFYFRHFNYANPNNGSWFSGGYNINQSQLVQCLQHLLGGKTIIYECCAAENLFIVHTFCYLTISHLTSGICF